MPRPLGAPAILITMAVGFTSAVILTWPRSEPVQPSWAPPSAAVRVSSAVAGQAARAFGPRFAAPAAPAVGQRVSQQAERAPQVQNVRPEMPVRVVSVDAPDPRYEHPIAIVRLISDSDDTLPLDVFVTTSDGRAKAHVEVVLGPHQSRQLAEGPEVPIQLGDIITVKNPGFSDLVHEA